MYISLARKYRPRTFASVAVQSHVSATLRGAIARGRVAHGYLLCGPRGVGKTTLARVLAMALNCERRDAAGEPCGECASCQRIWSGAASLDVVEIDAASNRGVDDARELRERAMYAPSGEDRYKVYIVDEAHMLTREAWNALLKILEEPPPRVVFVFATTEPHKIAQAAAPVLSRLQRFDFRRIGPADVRERLKTILAAEEIEAEPEALAMLARAADGSMRDALSLTDQVLSVGEGAVTAARVRDALGLVAEDEYLGMLDILAAGRVADVLPAVRRLADAGVDLGLFLAGLGDALRAQLAVTLGGEPEELSESARERLHALRDAFSAADLVRMLSLLAEMEPHFRRSGQQRLLLEVLLVRLALMDRTVAIEEVLRQMGTSDAGVPARGADARGRGGATSASDASDKGSASGGGQRAAEERPRARRTSAAGEAPAATPADAPVHSAAGKGEGEPLELNRLVERWGEVIDRLRTDGRAILASALEQTMPASVTARGVIEVELDAENELAREGIAHGEKDVLAAVRAFFPGATALRVRGSAPAADAPPAAPKRLTEEAVREERVAMLRTRNPVLDAAVDALDLELLD
ncbi:MAG TPA: DNA polymerase III subunit gamma/tau [Gemmatimonadaceae bacterium]|nr:DNA polymerase III subunit gamma/tau [Gemmatimonadaceae bacterium]